MKGLLCTLLLVTPTAFAETEIFRCPQDDGSVAFQEMPCPDPAAATEDAESSVPLPDDDEPISQVPVVDEPLPAPASLDRRECEKAARDAIDAIDLEMRSRSYTKEEGQQYLADLRVLTRQLRACKQL